MKKYLISILLSISLLLGIVSPSYATTLYSNDFTSSYSGFWTFFGSCSTTSSGLNCGSGAVGVYATALSNLTCVYGEFTSTSGTHQLMLWEDTDESNLGHGAIFYIPSTGNFRLGNYPSSDIDSGVAAPSSGTHTYGLCKDGNSYTTYKDGSLIQTENFTGLNPNQIGFQLQDGATITNFQATDTLPELDVKLETSPAAGTKTVGSPFSVNVAVNSTNAFNAARATVSTSSNLTINSISAPTSNSCNMQYTQTPTTSNPSFAGAIYGSSSTNCNIYTMVVTPNDTGTGTITFSNGSVKAYSDNSEIMTGVTNASFTLSDGPTPTPTPLLEFEVTSPYETYKENFTITGTKLSSITAMFLNGDDEDSVYPTSTSWEIPVTLSLGNNNFTLYGSDGTNQTATQNLIIDRHTLGDINGDGEIDLIDASLFAVDWDKTEDLTYILSDMNDDEVVDLTDLSILAKLQE